MSMSRESSIYELKAMLDIAKRNKEEKDFAMALHFYREIINANFPYIDRFDQEDAEKIKKGVIEGVIEIAINRQNEEAWQLLEILRLKIDFNMDMLIKLYSGSYLENQALNTLREKILKHFIQVDLKSLFEGLSQPTVDLQAKKLILTQMEKMDAVSLPRTRMVERELGRLHAEAGEEKKAVAHYQEAASRGEESSTYKLARAFQTGDLRVVKDEKKSAEYYMKLCDMHLKKFTGIKKYTEFQTAVANLKEAVGLKTDLSKVEMTFSIKGNCILNFLELAKEPDMGPIILSHPGFKKALSDWKNSHKTVQSFVALDEKRNHLLGTRLLEGYYHEPPNPLAKDILDDF